MSWQPSLSWQHAKARSGIINKIRSFFTDRGLVEVETPLLSNGTITDVHIDAFTSRYNFLADTSANITSPLYLQTSPEFAMKRLLASGYGSIFQICKAFRHEEYGRYHNPEFTMLEWYRLGFNHFDLMSEVADLLINVLNCPKPTQVSYQSVFLETVQLDPLSYTRNELFSILDRFNKMDDWLLDEPDNDILLQYVFSEIIEPTIGKKAPCFVYNFPSSQASLARISDKDARVAERFECYYHGIELVNGFHELTNANQQLDRFNKDNDARKKKGFSIKPIDGNLIKALQSGLPECSGVALGIDRLVMLALNAQHIKHVISFGIEDA